MHKKKAARAFRWGLLVRANISENDPDLRLQHRFLKNLSRKSRIIPKIVGFCVRSGSIFEKSASQLAR